MNFPCPTRSLCIDPANPFSNLSAEGPDNQIFIGFNSGWDQNKVPVGSVWDTTGCVSFCQSTVSQMDADLCAARQQIICSTQICPGTPDCQGGGDGGGRTPQPQLFPNVAETCTVLCPDNLGFNYTFSAGLVLALSQQQANDIATSLACITGLAQRICLNPIQTGACLNQPYFSAITTMGGTPAFFFSQIGGTLPPGLTLSQPASGLELDISGTPTSTGNYSFTIQVVDRFGNFMRKTYTISVVGITNTPVQAELNQFYLFSFSVSGGTPPYTFSAIGSLPIGLTLSSAGLISGTPTQMGASTFQVVVTDASGITCSFQETVTVANNCNCAVTNWQVPASIGKCRLRIHGYFDGMIPNCPGASASVAPTWDGTFPNILILFSQLYQSAQPVSIQGKTITGNGIALGFSAGIWSLAIQSDAGTVWIGRLTSACPIGVFTQGADPQCDVGPATITLEGYSL